MKNDVKNIDIQFKANSVASATMQTLEGEQHLVFPVIAAVETVMNKLLYTEKEMKKTISGWNGVPITVNHPSLDGVNVSANSPSIMEKFSVGKLFNVKYEDGIKGEIWLNVNQALRKGFQEIVDRLKGGEIMEVSTGLQCQTAAVSGVFNTKEYSSVVSNILPDHLAILPKEAGACSIQDGCGTMRTNCECSGNVESECTCEVETNESGLKDKMLKAVKSVFRSNSIDHNGVRDQLKASIRKKLGRDRYFHIEAVFDNYVVFESDGGVLIKNRYRIENDLVILEPGTVEVIRQAEFKEIKSETIGSIENNKMEEKDMSENKSEGAVSTEQASVQASNAVETIESVIEGIKSKEIKEILTNSLAERNEKRDVLMGTIVSNSEVEKSDLGSLSTSALEKLAALQKLQATNTAESTFVGSGNAGTVHNSETEMPTPPSISAMFREQGV